MPLLLVPLLILLLLLAWLLLLPLSLWQRYRFGKMRRRALPWLVKQNSFSGSRMNRELAALAVSRIAAGWPSIATICSRSLSTNVLALTPLRLSS